MSNAFAVAGVSSVLRKVLEQAVAPLPASLKPIKVTTLAPDRVIGAVDSTANALMLFLYQVSYNAAWRNRDLPSHDEAGERTSNPPLALDLHFLLAASGRTEHESEVLLGVGMQAFHEIPVVSRERIGNMLGAAGTVTLDQCIAGAELADQFEQIRMIPETLSTEDMSKLWSAIQSHYRVSAAYQASVVLIQRRKPARTPLPVKERNVVAETLRLPEIESIEASTGEPGHVFDNSTIILGGRDLVSPTLQVFIDELIVPAVQVQPDGEQLRVTLPPLPPQTHTGIKTVRVLHPRMIGSPPAQRGGASSNRALFALRPRIVAPPAANVTSTRNAGGVALKTGTIDVTVSPNVARTQQVSIALSETPPPAGRRAFTYNLMAPPGNGIPQPATEAPIVSLPFVDVAAGIYLLRLQVDGAQSALDFAGGRYSGPTVAI